MARSRNIRPPFGWLGRYTQSLSLVAVLLLAAFFRFWQLSSLPPGLHEGAARIGLQALNLINHGWLPGFDAINAYTPLWVWLQAISIKLFGHTELALRLWPAILGVATVFLTWEWVKAWFGLRTAWLAAFLLAVTPWAVTISRDGSVAALFPFLLGLTLWLATRARQQATTIRYLLLACALALDLAAGPVGWLIVILTLGLGIVRLTQTKQLGDWSTARIVGLASGGVLTALTVAGVVKSWSHFHHLPSASGFTGSFSTLGHNTVDVLLMFNVRGDENYHHNLASEPMLNVFVGLMLITGILVAISRLHLRPYRTAFIFAVAMLLPAILSSEGVPNAAHAAAALPLILTFSAIGISYMLELWYTTFPINSAARATGQFAILTLLALSLFVGYTQYFRAWAGSSEVYNAYHEGATTVAHHVKKDKFIGQRYVVGSADDQAIVAYLTGNAALYQNLDAAGLVALPNTPNSRQFYIMADERENAAKNLKAKFPGGVLRPHYSPFNQTEIYYTYEITK